MRVALVIAISALLLAPAVGLSQSLVGTDPGSSVRTREELQRLLAEYEQALASPAYSESVKRSIRTDADRIRSRLEQGDFRIGDRIILEVEGEPGIPDTVSVEPGPKITLPVFGEIPLAGVLRSEVQAHLSQSLSRFIRDPVVRATGLMRLSVVGEVLRPGFYTMPAQMLVGEALMAAGGPSPASNLEELRIERGATVLFEGSLLQEAMREGFTLDQLNLQAGDQIVVPQERSSSWLGNVAVIAGVVGSLATLVVLFVR